MALPPDQVFYVSPAQINEWRAKNEAVIVDVREDDEWNEAHIPGAILMPLSTFDPSKIPDPHGKHLVFHCRSGRRCGLVPASGGVRTQRRRALRERRRRLDRRARARPPAPRGP